MGNRRLVEHGMKADSMRLLLRRSNARGSAQLALHAALLGATGLLIGLCRGRVSWLLPAMLLHGVVLDFLFCAMHETTHQTAFANRRLNTEVAWLCGALQILPPEYFRQFHFAHHRFTQDAARDPELAEPRPETLPSYLWYLSGLPTWAQRIKTTLRHALTGRVAESFVPAALRGSIVREARVLCGCYLAVLMLSLAYRSDAALMYWILPAIAGQPFLRIYLLSEHVGCAAKGSQWIKTRTVYTNAAIRFLAWQMPFHAEHHAYPSVPFHALGKLNALNRSRVSVSAPGYLALHVRLFRLLRAGRGTRAVR